MKEVPGGRICATLLAAAVCLAGNDAATQDRPPLTSPASVDYVPRDKDERGLWMEMDEAERQLRDSNFIIRDAALNAYVNGVLCRTVGEERCRKARIYLVRTPYFNANMAPNGMMQVWSGLLLRVRDEAQLAAVLGHEFGHFEKQHSLQLFRDIKAKTSAMMWLSFLPYGVGLLGQIGLMGSVFQFNRDMERDADLVSIEFLYRSGYAPASASRVWGQFRAEMDATAVERKQKSRKDRNGGFFATHPNSGERVAYLEQASRSMKDPGEWTGEAEYRAAMVNWWAPFIDDQIKLNDFGGTEFLLGQLAGKGWSGELLYARGELYRSRGKEGDFGKAADFYRQALAAGFAQPEVWRGLGLALLRGGWSEEGRQMLKEYLKTKPDAGDRAMMIMLAGGE